jgi:KRAB domain-containing zinc finger protein
VHKEKVKCPICFQIYQQTSIKCHMKMHEIKQKERSFKCEICSSTFFSKYELKNHENTHNKSFNCTLCDGKFAVKLSLTEHLMLHADPNAFKCELCGRCLSESGSLKRHMKTFHKDGKTIVKATEFFCKICSKEYRDAKTLYNHERTHGERKNCLICFKSCSCFNLSTHMKMHELKQQEKSFKCEKCNKTFYTKKQLNIHIKCHLKLWTCDLCGKKEATKGYLKIHLMVHFNPKAFKCETCEKCSTNFL